jgi:hypothetical protein
VLFFKTASSGTLLLVGQVADGISTLIIGLLAEKLSNILICRYSICSTSYIIYR